MNIAKELKNSKFFTAPFLLQFIRFYGTIILQFIEHFFVRDIYELARI